MGMLQRMRTIFSSKVNHVLDAVEDPRETLDFAYERQREQYKKLKQSIVTVATEKNRLGQQRGRAQEEITRWDQAARNFLAAADEEQAAVAIERKQAAERQLAGLEVQISSMEQEQGKLQELDQQMAQKLDSMRRQKDMLKAQYTAAKAQTDIQSALGQYSSAQRTQSPSTRATRRVDCACSACRIRSHNEADASDAPAFFDGVTSDIVVGPSG